MLGDDELAMQQRADDLDAVAVDIHPDELDVDFYAELAGGSDGEEEQMNEDAQRLREIIDNDHSDDESSQQSDLSDVGEKLVQSSDLEQDQLRKLEDENFVEVTGLASYCTFIELLCVLLVFFVSPQNGRGIALWKNATE